MKRLAIITIGIPGSGKTTAVAPLVEKYGLTRISRDEIRQEWFGNPILQEDKEGVILEAERRAKAALAEGHSVIKDSTFTERSKRIEAISSLREGGADRIIGIVFNTPLETAEERNSPREFPVDDRVIEIMYGQLQSEPPQLDEGFDAIYSDAEMELVEKELSALS
jgi:predicted kinase